MAHFVLECQLCQRKFMTRTNLLMHLALCHFKTFLIERFVRTADNSCSVCDKSFKHSKSILYHLAITHNALDDRLAKIAKRVPWKRPVTFSYQKCFNGFTFSYRKAQVLMFYIFECLSKLSTQHKFIRLDFSRAY